MEDEQKQEEVKDGVEEVVEQTEEVTEVVSEEKTEEAVEAEKESEREKNLKAENARKQQEIQRLREEIASRTTQNKPRFDPVDVRTWNDNELKICLKDPQYAARHDEAEEELHRRRIARYNAERDEQSLRMDSELERQTKFPETFDPTHPMAVRMSELMRTHRLDSTPSGRLVAAKLAASELERQRALTAGRKKEQTRQTDVKANFQGESGRPAPKVKESAKLEELKKRAMAGDAEAKEQWFKHKGLI